MPKLICPNCRAIVPSTAFCENCFLPLGPLPTAVVAPGLDAADSMAPPDDKKFHPMRPNVTADMDPHLQRDFIRTSQNVRMPATASTKEDQVAVIARVIDADSFESLLKNFESTRPGITIAPTPGTCDTSTLMTARILIRDAEKIREAREIVQTMKASTRLKKTLFRTSGDIRARQMMPRQDEPANDDNGVSSGTGVIVGIVDSGFNFSHERFQTDENKTRLLFFWDQTANQDSGGLGSPSPLGYGKVYTKDDINAALKSDDPFRELGYKLPMKGNLTQTQHGTVIADIAAGRARADSVEGSSTVQGVAPEADLIFVEVARSQVALGNVNALEASFGDSAQVLEAIKFIFDMAGDRPCVVNLSMGTCGGSHDGAALVEEGIDRLVSQGTNRAVIVAAGNFSSEKNKIHASGRVNPDTGSPFALRWEIPDGDPTGNELEIWYSGKDQFGLELIAPDGTTVDRIDPGENRDIPLGGEPKIFVVNRLKDPANDDSMINIFFERSTPAGVWTLLLHPINVVDGSFHAWIERDDHGRSRFVGGDSECTLSSLACGKKSIVVGAYSAYPDVNLLKPTKETSLGPTRPRAGEAGRERPDLSAPGHVIFIPALSRSGHLPEFAFGTSAAAAVVTGAVALILAQAHSKGMSLDVDKVRSILIESAKTRRDAITGQDWHKQLGNGRLSVSAALDLLHEK